MQLVSRFSMCLALAGCGPSVPADVDADTSGDVGENDTGSNETIADDGDDDTSAIDLGSADASTGGADPVVVECPAFDPARVYLRGGVVVGESYPHALVDPESPTEFCVGFAGDPTAPRLRGDGSVVFARIEDEHGIYRFAPDPFAWLADGQADYPRDPLANDELLLATPCDDGSDLASLLVAPSDGAIWVRCGGAWLDPGGELAYDSIDPIGVLVAPDERLLVNESDLGASLFWVESGNGADPPLDLPRDVDAIVTGRVHEDGVRVVAIAGERVFLWRIDGDAIGEEGEYSELDVGPSIAPLEGGALAADGDFVHLVHASDSVDLVVRRRLDPEPPLIVYDEGALDPTAVRVTVSDLFTGP